MSPDNPPYSSEELARRWGCSAQHVRDLIRIGKIRSFRVGRLIRVPAKAVTEFEECETTSSSSIEVDGTPFGAMGEGRNDQRSAPKFVRKPNAA